MAFALPRRHGGIVVSDGTLRVLDGDELAAVLAHEQAHLDQRHHLVTTLVEGIARALRPIPLVTAAAIPTTSRSPPTTPMGGDVLHAAGPGRVRHVVAPAPTRSGAAPALATVLHAATLGAVSVTTLIPYVFAAVTICA